MREKGKSTLNEEQKLHLKKLVAEGKTNQEIFAETGIDRVIASRYRTEYRRKMGIPPKQKVNRETVYALYKKGLGIEEVAEQLNITYETARVHYKDYAMLGKAQRERRIQYWFSRDHAATGVRFTSKTDMTTIWKRR